MVAAKEKTLSFNVDPISNRMGSQLARQPAASTTPTAINRISSYDFRTRKFKKSPIGPKVETACIVSLEIHRRPRKYVGENLPRLRRLHWAPKKSLYRAYFVPGKTDPKGLFVQEGAHYRCPSQCAYMKHKDAQKPPAPSFCKQFPDWESYVKCSCQAKCAGVKNLTKYLLGFNGNGIEAAARAKVLVLGKGLRDDLERGPKSGIWPDGFWLPGDFTPSGDLAVGSRKHSAIRHCIASGFAAREVGCSCSQCAIDGRDLWQYKCQKQPPANTRQAFFNDQEGRKCAGCGGAKGNWNPWFYYNSNASVIDCCWKKLLDGELATGVSGPTLPPLFPLPPR